MEATDMLSSEKGYNSALGECIIHCQVHPCMVKSCLMG